MKIGLLLLAALCAVPSMLLAAGQDEPAVYAIKQGDTIWGLSERFIKDPKYWPNMWSQNGQITNPNFIYPGQKVRIFPDRLEFVPKEQPITTTAQKSAHAAAAAAETLQEVSTEKAYRLYGTESFLVEKGFKPYGLVVGSPHDRVAAGIDDIVYTDIGTAQNAKSGDKFSIFRKDVSVSHPLNNEEMGYKIVPLGTLQLTDVEQKSSRAIITKSFREIGPGSFLLPYKDSRRREVALKNNGSDLKGYIVESCSGSSIIGAGDVVHIDLGAAHGAEVGNMLYIVRDVTIDQRYVEGRIERLPQELLGALVILEADKRTSTALVVKSIDTIYKGDRLVSQTK